MSSEESRPRLILFDGHAIAYRQFYALRSDAFSTAEGQPTNAVYGFTRTIIEVLEKHPQYIAVAFDRGLSGRDVLYPDYKGTRDKMPEDLASQMDYIEQMVQAFNIPLLAIDEYEADDIIGTVARQAEKLGCDVTIITGDRDLLQLLTPHIQVQLPDRQAGEDRLWDEEAFAQSYGGLNPHQLIDLKALMGDNSDNIPGVMGIGDKGAVTLIKEFGSLDGLYERLTEVKKGYQEKLRVGQESAFLSHKLATILTDLPLTLTLADCLARDFDPQEVLDLFNELEFGDTLRKRLNKVSAGMAHSSDHVPADDNSLFIPPHTVVRDAATLAELAEKLNMAQIIAFDTETTGLDKMAVGLVGISLAIEPNHAYYIPVGHISSNQGDQLSLFGSAAPPDQLPLQTVLEALRPAMTNPAIPKVAHNAGYDWVMLRRYGLEVQPIADDTMLAEFVLNPDSKYLGLKRLAYQRLRLKMQDIDELIGKGAKQITIDRVPIDLAAGYAAADASATFQLQQVMKTALTTPHAPKAASLYENLEVPLITVLATMEMHGVLIDRPYLKELAQEFEGRLHAAEQEVFALVGKPFQINSPKQLNDILFDHLKFSTAGLKKTKSGDFSLAANVLEELVERENHPVLPLLMNYRTLYKLYSTYVMALPDLINAETGRVHTSFNQTGTVTGRISSSNPNLQNIPIRTEEGRRVRRAFIADAGRVLLSVDYSQIELRILAHYSDDQTLKQAFYDGLDIHRATAAKVSGIAPEEVTYDQRRFAKSVNFGLMYGMGAFRLARDSGLPLAQAQTFIDDYFRTFPTVKDYLESTKEFARQNGYVQTLWGRRRYFPELQRTDVNHNLRTRAEREAINTPIQGSAADMMKQAMLDIHQTLADSGSHAKLMLQVHDELVLEVPEDELHQVKTLVVDAMQAAGSVLNVPVIAEARTGQNWASLEE